MTFDVELIKVIAELISALTIICGVIFACYRWYLKQNKQDADIKAIKEENALICYALQACLDGLKQLNCNGEVTKAHDKLTKHLNVSAHK